MSGSAAGEDVLEPSSVSTNALTAYHQIKRRILGNEYVVGSPVSVQEIAELLKMSRTPIKNALIRLAEERLVELIPRHGFRVLPISATETTEIYRIVIALELLAIELAIERGPARDELAGIEYAISGMEQALAADNLAAWAEFDEGFHVSLIRLSANARLIETITQFKEQTRRVRQITLRLRARPVVSTKNHRELLTAIIERNAEKACKMHREQRLRSCRELTKILQELDIRHL
jgi:DNA-binding GntR family transcriptional regulator